MESSIPPLRFLHDENTLNLAKLAHFRRLTTAELKTPLIPGQVGSLKARSDGTILDGHHRIKVLIERNDDVNRLPRQIMEKEQ